MFIPPQIQLDVPFILATVGLVASIVAVWLATKDIDNKCTNCGNCEQGRQCRTNHHR